MRAALAGVRAALSSVRAALSSLPRERHAAWMTSIATFVQREGATLREWRDFGQPCTLASVRAALSSVRAALSSVRAALSSLPRERHAAWMTSIATFVQREGATLREWRDFGQPCTLASGRAALSSAPRERHAARMTSMASQRPGCVAHAHLREIGSE